MGLSIIRGTNDKPAASAELASSLESCTDIAGTLFIGYPIVNTPEGPHHFDALLVSVEYGVVVIDVVEGNAVSDYPSRQDESANLIEARLRTNRRLMDRRALRIPIRALTFAPAGRARHDPVEDGYPVADSTTLVSVLRDFVWQHSDYEIYLAALSAIQNVGTIRKSRMKRVVAQGGSRGARLKSLEESIATLDRTQSRAVVETVDGAQRIRGLAGSGKTVVLALKAAYLHAQHPDWRIAVTFNTRSLKTHFRRLITGFSISQASVEPDWDNLRIVNAWGATGGTDRDGIYHEFCRTHDLTYFDFGSARQKFRGREFEGVCKYAIEQVKRSDVGERVYDVILVDEAQDLPAAFLSICYKLLREPRRLTYAYDELQNLVGPAVVPPDEMFGTDDDGAPRVRFDSGPDDDARDVVLNKCYRNSRPVLVTAHALGFGIYREPSDETDPGLVQMFDNAPLWHDIGYSLQEGQLSGGCPVILCRSSKTSPEFLERHSPLDDLVRFVCFDSKEDQTEWVATQIRDDLASGDLRHDDVVVINPDPVTTRDEVGPIRARLLDLNVNSHLAGVDTIADEFFNEHTDSVTFSGVHRAKGNEAGMVYVINAQDCYGGKRNAAGIRNRLFVAITRSKAWVRVVGVGKRMTKLTSEYERLKAFNFSLRFTYPTEKQRQQIRIVHRDMTSAERKLTRNRGRELGQLIEDLEAGRFHLEDLDAAQVKKLRDFLGR